MYCSEKSIFNTLSFLRLNTAWWELWKALIYVPSRDSNIDTIWIALGNLGSAFKAFLCYIFRPFFARTRRENIAIFIRTNCTHSSSTKVHSTLNTTTCTWRSACRWFVITSQVVHQQQICLDRSHRFVCCKSGRPNIQSRMSNSEFNDKRNILVKRERPNTLFCWTTLFSWNIFFIYPLEYYFSKMPRVIPYKLMRSIKEIVLGTLSNHEQD